MSMMPEFRASLKLTGQMAKDGRLKELMGAVLAIFHGLSVEGRSRYKKRRNPRSNPGLATSSRPLI